MLISRAVKQNTQHPIRLRGPAAGPEGAGAEGGAGMPTKRVKQLVTVHSTGCRTDIKNTALYLAAQHTEIWKESGYSKAVCRAMCTCIKDKDDLPRGMLQGMVQVACFGAFPTWPL